MSEITSDQSKQQHDAEKEARLQYVDTLAGPEDYWISITDAARVTRTSEAMARRWVTGGRLPIKREPVGLNQRTRMVRASDLQKIRTIIDPSAAITDDVRKIDLLSIPRQQQQIMEEQQRIVRLVEGSNAALATQEARMQEQATMLHEEIANEGLRVEKDIEGQIQLLREALSTQEQATGRLQESIQMHIESTQQALVAQEGKASGVLAALHETITGEISQVMQPLRDALGTQEQVIAHLQEETLLAVDSLRAELKRRQDEELEKLWQELNASIEYRTRDIDNAIQTLERDVARDNADFTQKLMGYDQQFEQVRMNIDANRSIALGSQKRVGHQDEQISDLKMQLQEEAQARQLLAERVEALVASAEKPKVKTRKKEE